MYERIKMLCEKYDMNIHQLEMAVGVSNGYVTKLRNGASPTTEKILAIADYFGVSLDWLITGEGRTRGMIIAPKDKQLLDKFNSLNKDGQNKVLDYIDGLAASKKYIPERDKHIVEAEVG